MDRGIGRAVGRGPPLAVEAPIVDLVFGSAILVARIASRMLTMAVGGFLIAGSLHGLAALAAGTIPLFARFQVKPGPLGQGCYRRAKLFFQYLPSR